jgi:hypothetical protein
VTLEPRLGLKYDGALEQFVTPCLTGETREAFIREELKS